MTQDVQEIQDKTYPFGDLDDTARRAALAWWESEGLDDWAIDITDYAKEEFEDIGITISDISWSGFYSQGDGAGLTGQIDLMDFVDKYVLSPKYFHNWSDKQMSDMTILGELVRNGFVGGRVDFGTRGFRGRHTDLDDLNDYVESYADNLLDQGVLEGASVNDLVAAIDVEGSMELLHQKAQDKLNDIAYDVYKRLEVEYEYVTGEEHFADMADINGWMFTEKGELA